jgi:hypothetical protein
MSVNFMRQGKEDFEVGTFVHVYNRGNRKQAIVHDARDRLHFLQMLYYFNNEALFANPFREAKEVLKTNFHEQLFWPSIWGERKPLVKIIAFALVENYYHFLLKEIQEEGISRFMRRVGTGMAKYFNAKYQEVGGLFQGSYKAKVVSENVYLQYLSVYIQVKNIFELYPSGIEGALKEFDTAYDWTVEYPYCSLGDYAGSRNSPIVDKDLLGEMFPTSEKYKEFARTCLTRVNLEMQLGNLTLE